MVYQDLAMSPDLTVWQNLFLGEERHRRGFLLDRRGMRSLAGQVLRDMKTKIQPDYVVSDLSGGTGSSWP
jgi:ABC-type sugar transport system ATPase subunit